MSRLFYRGPSLDVLHERYAKRGRIDENAPITASRAIGIDAPVARVWAQLSNPAGWGRLDPDIDDVRLAGAVGTDVSFTWKNGSARIRSRFAVVDEERELTWTGVSFGAKVVHRHLLEPTASGGTRLVCEESMAGPPITLLFSSAKLDTALERWLTAIKAGSERSAS